MPGKRSIAALLGIAPLLVPVLLAGCGSGGKSSSPVTTTTAVPPSSGAAAALQHEFVRIIAQARPQVVEIQTSSGLGSGVIYDAQGDIVTNDHVVGSASTFIVQLADGQQLKGTLVGAYPADDLAVIRVDGGKNLSPAKFGNSAALEVGDLVFAVGSPLGLASSVTDGIVSYNGRAVNEGNGVQLASVIQTSAAINPGNSGGALVDIDGQVVGIPTLAAVNQQAGGAAAGIGFAIPSNTVKLIVPQLIATGHVSHSDRAALDVTAADAVDRTGNPLGVLVVQTVPGSSAARAGLMAGDLITSVNAQKVTSVADLQGLLAALTPGATVNVAVTRQDGSSPSLNVVLGELQG